MTRRPWALIPLAMILWLGQPLYLSAHDTLAVGRFRLTVGWGEEPAFSGSRNRISVTVTDAAGQVVTDAGIELNVEVIFGEDRVVLPLKATGDHRGEVQAWLVPTRPGTYALHITGAVVDQIVNVTSTCSDRTFDCVADVSDVQFPAKDPSAGQLAEGVRRVLPRAEGAVTTAADAIKLALAAVAIAALALAVTIGRGLRRGA